jgi:hypothetical protein
MFVLRLIKMNNEPYPQPIPPSAPADPANQLPDPYLDALKSVHSAGTWSIALGVINIVLTPLLGYLLYAKATNGASLVIAELLIGLVIGGVFIGLGLSLKRTAIETVIEADRKLLYVAIAIAIALVLSFVLGGRSVGLLNVFAVVKASQARSKIKKLK